MVDGFFKKVKDAIVGEDEFDQSAEQEQQGFSTREDEYRDRGEYDQYGDVSPASEDPYGDPAGYEAAAGYEQYGDVRPASEDPYGDPGVYEAAEYGDVRPASEDPFGDPADQIADYGDVRPASEDPFGDPADQYNA
jgi:hypothetical protein